ncbi:TSG10 protein, partial [Oreotrochilus melanogaster]|nr:TSG10 protein [Oreotrochilus melanogaster]
EREELKSSLKKLERRVAENQGNVKVLTAERDRILSLYEWKEISRLHQEVIKCPRTRRSTVTAQAMLRHVEIERDTALSDFQRMTTERDSLREQLKISQETAFKEKAHLEQRIEELETTIQNLDSERLEQMSKVALMKGTIESLETERKRLARRALDSETELSQQKAEYVSLSLLNEKTKQSLLETQQSLSEKEYEIQERTLLLNEKIDNFSRRSLVQQEEICALKETIAQLDKEKATLQSCVEEGREKIATFEESLATKEKIISDFKILNSELEHSRKKSAEALCIYEKDIASLHQELQETNRELEQANKNRESLAQENNRLQDHLSNIKHENQVLCKKIANYQNVLGEIKLKALDSNTDIVRLQDVLKSKERENCELLEDYYKAHEQGESWKAKCHQAEADCSSVRLALISAESENLGLKEKMEFLETEIEQGHIQNTEVFIQKSSCALQCLVLLVLFFRQDGAVMNVITAAAGLCISLQCVFCHVLVMPEFMGDVSINMTDSISEFTDYLNNKCESSHCEIELLRKQLGNERASVENLESLLAASHEKEFQSQIAKEEKDSEIQFLMEQLSLAENKLALQSSEITQLRNRVAELELDLDFTKRQLGTERFERQ